MSARPDERYAVLSASDLTDLVERCFQAAGLGPGDAETVADVLVEANLAGIDSHGVERAPVYMRRVRRGAAGGSDRLRWAVQGGAVWRLDAGHALGPLAGVAGIDQAMALAGRFGVGVVAVASSSHFGAAGYYAARAARAGLVAMVMSNAARSMAPHGGAQPFLGANPIAIGAPLGRHGEFILDMSTSTAARGRMRRAQALGEALEPGLALDATGAATTDPAAALAGAVLPAAGPKGSGLAMAISIMACLLGGADLDDEIGSMYSGEDAPQNIGHVFWVMHPGRLMEPDQTIPRVEAMIDRLHGIQPSGDGGVLFAGERQARTAQARLRDGIPVARGELARLAAEARDCGDAHLATQIERAAAGTPVPQ